jgi:hypothetical protein
LSILATAERFSGFATVIERETAPRIPPEPRTGRKPAASYGNGCRPETAIFIRGDFGFEEWVGSFLENYSSPPIRAAKTHEEKLRRATYLKAASSGRKLVDITADAIEDYRHRRLRQRRRVRPGLPVKPRNVGQPRITIA